MNTRLLGTLLTIGFGISAWAATPISIDLGKTLLIDDFADLNMSSNLGPWSVYPDAGGESTVTPSFVSDAGTDGESKALRVDYSLDGYDILEYEPFMEVKVFMATDSTARDLSNCSEVQYEYRGNQTHYFKAISNIDVGDNYHRKGFDAKKKWTTATVHWDEMRQYDISYWGIPASVDNVKKNLVAYVWQVQEYDGTKGYLEIANVRCANKPTYTINFYIKDSLAQTQELVEGSVPEFSGSTWFSNKQYEYYVIDWSPELVAASANANYNAILDSSIRSYEITFKDFNDDQLTYQYLNYGTVPSYAGIEPVKLPSVGYTYTFKGWGKRTCGYVEQEYCDEYYDEEEEQTYRDCWTDYDYVCTVQYLNPLPAVTENAGYYPVYDSTVNTYTVKFADYDGKELSKTQYAYGTRAEDIVKPTNPTRAAKNGVEYTFEKWIPNISSVSGNVVYVASYTATSEEGDVEVYDYAFVNGDSILQAGEYEDGTTPEYTGQEPTKEPTADLTYYFYDWKDQDGWYLGEDNSGNKIYMALFDEQYRKYWIVFLEDDGSVIDSVQYEYGDGVYDGEVGGKSYEDGYEREGWTPELRRVTGRAVYQAVYRYRVRFKADGNNSYDGYYLKGEVPDCRYCNPEKAATAEYTYTFIGWDKEYTAVTDTTTYNAVFMANPVPAAPLVNIAEGDSWLIDDFEDGDEISMQGGTWFVYNDSAEMLAEGAPFFSKISKIVAINGDDGNVMSLLYNRACIEEKENDLECYGWLGAGVALSADASPVDLSQCNAIQYDYRGGAHKFRVESLYDKGVGLDSVERHLTAEVEGSENWKTATLYRNNFWKGRVDADVAFSHAIQFVWSDMEGEGTLEIDNIKCVRKPEYAVKFYNGETLVDSAMFAEGNMPEYNGSLSTWDFTDGMGDEHYDYEFAGWTSELVPVTGNAVYNAVIEKTPRTYEICYTSYFKGHYWNGGCQEVEYGKIPEYDGTPELDADNSCRKYAFVKWTRYDDEVGDYVDGLLPVTGYATYTASFTCEDPITYTITFLYDNGDTISSKKYSPGEWIDEPYPQKESTAKWTYEFNGWSPHVDSWVSGDATYTARFEQEIRWYDVVFKSDDGEYTYSSDWYPYGTLFSEIEQLGWDPEKYGINGVRYKFAGWSPKLTDQDSVTGPTSITALFDEEYAVHFRDYNGSEFYVNDDYETQYYPKGTPLSQIAKPADPTRSEYDYETEQEIEFEFAGWIPAMGENDSLWGPMTFIATYTSSLNKHLVTFMDGNDILYQVEVAQGDVPVYDSWMTPSDYETEEAFYTWNSEDGWDKPLAAVTGPVVYKAKYTRTPKTFEVVFKNDDGTELKRANYEYGAIITDAPSETDVLAGRTGEYAYSDKWCRLSTWMESVYDENTDEYVDVEHSYANCYGDGLEAVTENVTYVPNIKYRVRFYDGDGNLMTAYRYEWDDYNWFRYGVVPEYCHHNDINECSGDEIPTKTSSAAYDYTWNGEWSPELDSIRGPIDYIAAFDSVKRRYAVVFVDEDGSILLDTALYEYGTPATDIVRPADPTKEGSETESYTFAGWSLNMVTGNATYKASYIKSTRKYLVKFVAEDGVTPIASESYEYNTPVSGIAIPSAPAKEGFRFTGWTPEVMPVTAAITYKAVYIADSKFVITWRNDDGTLLKQEAYSSGAMPVYSGTTPTKESSVEFDYVFNGWSPSITSVTRDAEYTATYKSNTRNYKIRFANYDGTMLDSAIYAYGTPAGSIQVPSVPERPANETYTYTFAGWTPAITDVNGSITYTALFGNKMRTYTVTFKSDENTVWDTETYYYKEVVEKTWGPEKSTPECYYDFDKWVRIVGTSDTVRSDMEYLATYSSKCQIRRYELEFSDSVHNDWNYDMYEYGTKIANIEVPDVSDTTIGDCEYKFIGWTPEITDVVKHARYEATYEKTCNEQYFVTWVNYDNELLEKKKYNVGEKPKYNGTTPTRPSSSLYTYRFIGWTPTVVEVTKDAKYTAKYDSTIHKFDIVFKDRLNHEGFMDSLLTLSYVYGTKASAIDVPALADTTVGNCKFSFKKWEPEIADVTADVTYEAIFDSACVDPPVSSSSMASSSSAKSSSSSAKSSSSSAKSSSSSAKSSSSSAESSSSSAKSSSSSAKSSSSSAKSSSSSAKSSSSSAESSSSSAKSSSSSAKSSSSSAKGENTRIVADNLPVNFKFGFVRNVLTVGVQHPSNVHIQVFDMSGQLLYDHSEYVTGSRAFSLNYLEQGNYIVRVSDKSAQKVARVVIR